jgi:hypothetical protein
MLDDVGSHGDGSRALLMPRFFPGVCCSVPQVGQPLLNPVSRRCGSFDLANDLGDVSYSVAAAEKLLDDHLASSFQDVVQVR